jgi:hypothetical protein
MPEFFIPKEDSNEQRERVINSLIEYLEKERNAKVDSQRIYHLGFVHNGDKYEASVGQKGPYNDEIVVAILYDLNYKIHFIFTFSRGVAGGSPIMVGQCDVRKKVLFDNSN